MVAQDRRAVSMKELAETLGVSVGLIKLRVSDGSIRSVKVGSRRLIPSTEVERVLIEGC